MANTNEKLNLPIVNAIEDLKASNKDQRERLQKSTRAGLLAVRKSVDNLTGVFVKAFELQKMKDQFDREKAMEEARKDTNDIQKQASGAEKSSDNNSGTKLGLLFGGLALALGTAVGSMTAWTSGVVKATKGLTNLTLGLTKAVGKMLGITSSGKFAKITAGLDAAVKSVKGWNTKILDVLKTGAGKLAGVVSKITNSKFITTIKTFFTEVKALGSSVSGYLKAFGKTSKTIKTTFSMIGGSLKAFGGLFGTISKLANKVFWPISIIFASFKAIKDSFQQFADGDILGGLKTVVSTLVDELFAKPLDMVKDALAWVIGKFGGTDIKQSMNDFSFSGLLMDLIDGIFDGVASAVDWVKLLFTDPKGAMIQLWNGLFGAGSVFEWLIFKPISKAVNWVKGLFANPVATIKAQWEALFGDGGVIDWLVFKPISAVINWVKDLFGWSSEDAPKFNLRTYAVDMINSVIDSITGIFDPLINWFKNFDVRKFLTPKQIKFLEYVGVLEKSPTQKDLTEREAIRAGGLLKDTTKGNVVNAGEVIPLEALKANLKWAQENNDAVMVDQMSKMIAAQKGQSIQVVAPSSTNVNQSTVNSRQVNMPAATGRSKGNQYEHPLMQPGF